MDTVSNNSNNSTKLRYNQLPNEIIEQILFYCDGVSLVRCSMISKRFQSIAFKLFNAQNIWFQCVLNEIDDSVIQELCGQKNILYLIEYRSSPNSLASNPSDFWLRLYVKWWTLKNEARFFQPTVSVQQINPFVNGERNITCVKISGNLIISGHFDGSMSICDYIHSKIITSRCHSRMVTDFALVDLKGFGGLLDSDSHNDSLRQHHHVVSISKDKFIKFYPLQLIKNFATQQKLVLKPTSAELQLVRVYNNLCAIFAQNGLNMVWKMSLDSQELLTLNLTYVINWHSCYFDWINLWNNKILAVSIVSNKVLAYDPSNKSLDKAFKLPLSRLKILKIFIFKDEIIILITFSRQIYYSIGFESLQLLPLSDTFQSNVISITVWGPLVAFGLEDGLLCVYHCYPISQLSRLFQKRPIISQRITTIQEIEAIISIDINDYGKGPVIIAATFNCITIFKWF